MEEIDMSLVEVLIKKDEIRWLIRNLIRIWQADMEKYVKDVVRNENNDLEIRMEKIAFEAEKEND